MNKFSLGMITTCVTLLTGSFFIHPKDPYSSFIYTTVYAYEPKGPVIYQLEQSSDQTEPIRTSLSTPLNTPLSASLDSESNHHNASKDTSYLEESSNTTTQQVPANNHANTTYESVTSTEETDERTIGYFSVAGELFPLFQMGDPTLYGGQLMEANEYVYDFNGGGYHHLGVERMTRQGSLMLEAQVGDTVFYNGDAYMIYHIDYNVSNTNGDLVRLAYQYHQEGGITAATCESTAWMSPQRLFYLLPL